MTAAPRIDHEAIRAQAARTHILAEAVIARCHAIQIGRSEGTAPRLKAGHSLERSDPGAAPSMHGSAVEAGRPGNPDLLHG